jgi:hypothetical protein
MKFHAAILVPDGRVADNVCRDSDAMRRDAIDAKMMDEFQHLICENLTDDPVKIGKFWAQFGDFRHVLQWQQVEPLSAMGTFFVRGKMVAASFYFHGLVPDLDAAVLEATDVLFARWFGGTRQAKKVCRGLRSIKDRPLVVALPAGKSVLGPDDWRIIGNLCPCFAAVFFDRAEAAIQAVEAYWHNRGFRKGGSETDFQRN